MIHTTSTASTQEPIAYFTNLIENKKTKQLLATELRNYVEAFSFEGDKVIVTERNYYGEYEESTHTQYGIIKFRLDKQCKLTISILREYYDTNQDSINYFTRIVNELNYLVKTNKDYLLYYPFLYSYLETIYTI